MRPPLFLLLLLLLAPVCVGTQDLLRVEVEEGGDAVLPCLIGPRDDLREQLTWSWGGKRIPLRWLGPGLGAQVGPLGISLLITNVSVNTGGFYLCEKLQPENQTEPGNGTTLGAAVSVKGSDKRFQWNPPKEGVGDCGPRKSVSPKPLPYGDFPSTSESSGPIGLPPPNDSNPLLLYVWNRDGPQLWGKLPPCADTKSSRNQTGDPLELISSPGSPLRLPCGSPLASPFQGLVSWVLFHPGSLTPTPLLSLELGKGALVRELWVLGTPRGGSLLLLPHATLQDAGIYHCHHGNLTYNLQLTIISRPVWRWLLGAKGWKVPAIALAYVTICLAAVIIFLKVKRALLTRRKRKRMTDLTRRFFKVTGPTTQNQYGNVMTLPGNGRALRRKAAPGTTQVAATSYRNLLRGGQEDQELRLSPVGLGTPPESDGVEAEEEGYEEPDNDEESEAYENGDSFSEQDQLSQDGFCYENAEGTSQGPENEDDDEDSFSNGDSYENEDEELPLPEAPVTDFLSPGGPSWEQSCAALSVGSQSYEDMRGAVYAAPQPRPLQPQHSREEDGDSYENMEGPGEPESGWGGGASDPSWTHR
ncbi:B-lymphocyte antigen CD19 [Tachyglossus aculeatus]|uniref:B-lymphocyte antigen CD19 n=1 Tax=Tachyglossus aculeatus TaxID=9261 RepID=UPI0018F5BAF5|nr:B-lymphocyte antigen CD19 [Tachyglossus aculeatus]